MLETKPLRVGVEITGLDLRRQLDPDSASELKRILDNHQLMLFRDQDITPGDQIRLLGIFGNVLDEVQDGKRYQYVSGDETSVRPGRLLFHSDNHFTQVPLEVLSLYGERIGEAATPTLFVDNVEAYQRLPSELAVRLDGLDVVTKSYFHLGYSDRPARSVSPELEGGPRAQHPAVWRHPVTGAPFLYLTELHAHHLEGLPREESDVLLTQALDAIYVPDRFYEHHWRTGDLLVWNNRTVQHARGELAPTDGSPASARSVRRVAVGPVGFSDQFQFSPEALAAMKHEVDPFYSQDIGQKR
jgi:taurine dioxygenase